jgi:DNA adenine methylase
VRPPFAYYGGKVGLSRKLVDLLPPHRVYIEPFFGSGAVLFAKAPSPMEFVNDIDDGIVTFFRVLRERPEDLARVCRLTPYARAEYQAAVATEGSTVDDLERARLFWVRVNQSFAKTAGVRTGWSATVARTQSTGASVQGRIDRFAACAERLSRVTIEHCDAADLVSRMAKSADTVVYADPPYLHTTRVSASRNDYRAEMTEDDHQRLAEVLRATSAVVVLSGYSSSLYDSLYEGWWSVDWAVTAFSSNSRTNQRTGRVERVWMNRPPEDLWQHTEDSA